MTPRTYSQDKRAASAQATRERILDATLELYRERGIAATTVSAVAQRADVARGTVLNHFESAGGLLTAALGQILAQQDPPDERIFEGLTSRDDRVREFVAAMIGFQERSSTWWPVVAGEMGRPEFQAAEAEYNAAVARVMAAALGPELAADPAAIAALGGLVHPSVVGTFLWSFEGAGLDRELGRPLLADFAVAAIRALEARRHGSG